MKRRMMGLLAAMLILSGCSAQQGEGQSFIRAITEQVSQASHKEIRRMEASVPVDRLTLVNVWNPFPQGRAEGLVTIADTISCRNLILKSEDMQGNGEAVLALQAMAEAMEKDGVGPLRLTSAYRSYDYQATLFENKLQRVIAGGTEPQDAEAEAAREVARPGTSEHHTGLAFDFTGEDGTLDSFYQSAAYTWVEKFGADYGFVVRYKAEKSDMTGIIYEPWHLRYVGAEAARAMVREGLCLEEYLNRG